MPQLSQTEKSLDSSITGAALTRNMPAELQRQSIIQYFGHHVTETSATHKDLKCAACLIVTA